MKFTGTLKEIELTVLEQRLEQFYGNRAQVAKSLGISVGGLQQKLKKLGLTKRYDTGRGYGMSITEWIDAVRKLAVKSTKEWREKDPSSYTYMSTKGMLHMIAKELGLEAGTRGRKKSGN